MTKKKTEDDKFLLKIEKAASLAVFVHHVFLSGVSTAKQAAWARNSWCKVRDLAVIGGCRYSLSRKLRDQLLHYRRMSNAGLSLVAARMEKQCEQSQQRQSSRVRTEQC